jgi:phospholipid/cholesterol/gamma-HCH transport system substrate-binding protein
MPQNNMVETIIGAVVVAVAVVFLVFAYRTTDSGNLSGYELVAKLQAVDGIPVGTDVRLAGIKVGTVSDLTLDPKTYWVTMHMRIRNDVKIPDDSSLKVTSSGLLGSSYLAISPGGSDTMLAAGGQIQNTQGSVDLMELIGRFIGNGNGNGGSGAQASPQKPPLQAPQQLSPK